jgi:protein Xni
VGRLLAIDGLNIVRRVYEASPQPDSAEKAEIALRHALSSFRKLLGAHQPSHVLAAFDFGGPTWRHAIYPRYREQRAPMPSFLRDALPGFHRKLEGEGPAGADAARGRGRRRGQSGGQGSEVADRRHTDPRGVQAKSIIVNKRSMASGYAGLDNDLFYQPNTMMVFGDAKKVIEAMVKAVD